MVINMKYSDLISNKKEPKFNFRNTFYSTLFVLFIIFAFKFGSEYVQES